MITQEEHDRELQSVADELEGMVMNGEVKALAIIIVRKNGDLATRIRYLKDGKFPIIAGMSLVQHQLLHMAGEQLDNT